MNGTRASSRGLAAFVLLTTLASAVAPARAADTDNPIEDSDSTADATEKRPWWELGMRSDLNVRPKWELGFGTVFYTQPDYVGSDEYRFRAIPFPWIIYRGERFRADRETVQTKLFGTDRIRFDISTSGQIAVDSSDNDKRHGMPDLDWMLQIGPSITIVLMRSPDERSALELDLPIRPAFAVALDNFSYEGFVSSPQLEYKLNHSPYQFTAQLGLEFNDSEYNDHIYGVDPRFAVLPKRPEYDADGGYAGVRAAAGVARYFGRFYVGVFTRYYNLDGAAFEDSPLTDTTHCFVGGIAIGLVLTKSDEMVTMTAVEARSNEAAAPDLDASAAEPASQR